MSVILISELKLINGAHIYHILESRQCPPVLYPVKNLIPRVCDLNAIIFMAILLMGNRKITKSTFHDKTGSK